MQVVLERNRNVAGPETEVGTSVIAVIDDENSVRDALTEVLSVAGYQSYGFPSGPTFFEWFQTNTPDCVLVDVHMPETSGVEVLSGLNDRDYKGPVFVISGQGDIPTAVNCIKLGAFDFLEKPFDMETIISRINEALATAETRQNESERAAEHAFPGRDGLTPRELEVLNQITSGASNKEAGRILGISPRTIEVHRARIMEKLGAKNAADLVRIVLSQSPIEKPGRV